MELNRSLTGYFKSVLTHFYLFLIYHENLKASTSRFQSKKEKEE
jgi:hypothetical protein